MNQIRSADRFSREPIPSFTQDQPRQACRKPPRPYRDRDGSLQCIANVDWLADSRFRKTELFVDFLAIHFAPLFIENQGLRHRCPTRREV